MSNQTNKQVRKVVKKKKPSQTQNTNQNNQNNKKAKSSKKPSKKAKETQRAKLKKLEYTTTDLIPFIKPLDKGHTGFLMKEGVYMNIFMIQNQDFPNKEENEVVFQAFNWHKFYLTLDKMEIKMVGISLPLDTRNNQEYLKYKLEKSNVSEYRNILKEAIEEYKELSNRQYKQPFLFVYTNSYERLTKYNERIVASLSSIGIVKEISPEQKINVLEKLNNPFCFGVSNLAKI